MKEENSPSSSYGLSQTAASSIFRPHKQPDQTSPLFLHKLDIPSTFLLTAQINICLPRSPKTRYGQISAGSATFHCNRVVLFVQTPHVLHDDSWMKWFIFPHLRFPFSFSSEILCPALQLLQGCRPRSHQRSQLKTLHC